MLPPGAEPGTIQLPSSCRVSSTSNGPSNLPNSGKAVVMELSDSDVVTYYVLLSGLIYCPEPPCGIRVNVGDLSCLHRASMLTANTKLLTSQALFANVRRRRFLCWNRCMYESPARQPASSCHWIKDTDPAWCCLLQNYASVYYPYRITALIPGLPL